MKKNERLQRTKTSYEIRKPTAESAPAAAPTFWCLTYTYDGFFGAIITEAPDFLAACQKVKTLGIGPGGQVFGEEFPAEHVADIRPEDIDRVLTKEDMEKYG